MFLKVTALENSQIGSGEVWLNVTQIVRASQIGNLWFLVFPDGASCIVEERDWNRIKRNRS